MQDMCTKKSMLVGLIVGSLPVAYLFVANMYNYKNIFLSLFVFPVALLFSLITYKMRDEVSRAWIKFTTWWVPLQILLVALTPESSGGYFVVILDTQFAAIILSGLFVIISLLLIVVKFFSLRK